METTITPYRWYDQYHKQNRFDNDCSSTCDFKLITHRTALLPFQFSRPSSGAAIYNWLLRPACDAFETQLLSINDQKFIQPFNWIYDGGFSFDCQGAKATHLSAGMSGFGNMSIEDVLTIGHTYRISFSVVDVKNSGHFTITLYNGVNELIDFNSVGYYEIEFTATTTDINYEINFTGGGSFDDYISFNDIFLQEVFVQQSFDIVLDKTLVNMYTVGALEYFIYPGTDLGITLPIGDYYSIIMDTDGTLYFSEIITVKNFLIQTSPYYILKWTNNCDLQDVIYQDYHNILYLDEAVLTRPEYPFKEEGEEDGNQEFHPTFQKWEKKVSLLIGRCPEFIVDALTAIPMHDVVELTTPLRKNQRKIDSPITVRSVETDTQLIFNDCFSNVELKLLLQEKYIDTTCCNNNLLEEFLPYTPKITEDDIDKYTEDGEIKILE